MIIENNKLCATKGKGLKWINKNKKITGHTFVALAGLDRFNKPGDALLAMYRYLLPEVDPKWLRRGSVAEKVIQRVYARDNNIATYDAAEIGYDNFPSDPVWGGIIDIELKDKHTLIEVKSKSMKDYDFVQRNMPKAEIYQAALYAKLRGYDKFTMEYIFFDAATEQEIFNNNEPTTLKNLKRYTKEFALKDLSDLDALMQRADKIRRDFLETGEIPLELVSEASIEKLRKNGLLE